MYKAYYSDLQLLTLLTIRLIRLCVFLTMHGNLTPELLELLLGQK